jgi:hypothetical protein
LTIPLITALPADPPSTNDPSTFDARADALLGALPDMVTEENAAITAMNVAITQMNLDIASIASSATVAADAAGLRGDSNTSLSVAAGNKDIVLTSAKASLMTVNRQVVLVSKSDASVRMFGNIDSSPAPTSTTARVVVTTGGVFGSGTYSDWHVIDAAFFSPAATAAEEWEGESDAAPSTPKSRGDAAAPVAVAYASTLALNMNEGRYRRMSASASFTLGIPTNAKAGQAFILDTVNTAGSIVLAVNAAWDRRNGVLGVLNPDNGAKNKIIAIIDEVDGSGNMTRGTYEVFPGLA